MGDDRRILCLGYFGRGNCGDEAFVLAHEWLFGRDAIEIAGGRLRPEDVRGREVILGGGDVVAPFFLDWIPRGTPFRMVGVGLKYEHSSAAALVDRGTDLRFAWFRNRADLEICRPYGIPCGYVPDLVFALRDEPYVRAPTRPPDIPPPARERVVVCMSDHFNARHGYEEPRLLAYCDWMKWELARALDSLAERYEILFLPLSVYRNHYDHRMHADVMSRMRHGGRCLWREVSTSPAEALSIFATAHHVISMKLHGNIFGLVTGRACVNIGIGRKQRLLYEEAGLGAQSLKPYALTAEDVLAAFERAREPAAVARVRDYAEAQHALLVAFRERIREELLASA
jgi:polysaccharide pyruvyl transferase WcaK-like protein